MNFTEAIAMARSGNEAGYRYLYETTYKSKYYLALQYMKNQENAQDVIQDSYIKAFEKLDTLKDPEAFSSWLGRIVANTAKNALLKKNPALFSDMEQDDQGESFENLIEDDRISGQPELSYTRQETRTLVREMIDSLSDEQRLCILMFYIEGESIKNIAAVLGCSENTVKSRLNYGRKNLKAKAEDLQKKGYRLLGIIPVVLLCRLLQKEETVLAAEGSLSAAEAVSEARVFSYVRYKISNSLPVGQGGTHPFRPSNVLPQAAPGAAAGSGAGIASATIVKILAGVIIAALAGIGALTAKMHFDSRQTVPESVSAVETAASSEMEEKSDTEKALEQYRMIVAQADSYDYGDTAGTPTGIYRYALVMMSPEDSVPTLLLSQENDMYFYHVRVFRYDPETGSVIQPSEVLEEGTGRGYYRSSLSMEGDGNGIRLTEILGGTGDTEITRVTLKNSSLHKETQWTGRMDEIPGEIGTVEISWHDSHDTAPLDQWDPGSRETASAAETVPETAVPQDGDRIVFTGTVNTYSYDQIIALQGCPDPNAQYTDKSMSLRLIVLDSPQTMELRGLDGYRSGEVTLINVSGAEGLEAYDGQHLTFSIDPASTYWPSDTSLPLGQPATSDIHILP